MMPYIHNDHREQVEQDFIDGGYIHTKGDLNYLISTVCKAYLKTHGLSYSICNDIVGALECTKQEFYRRIVTPYENRKIIENGDVY